MTMLSFFAVPEATLELGAIGQMFGMVSGWWQQMLTATTPRATLL